MRGISRRSAVIANSTESRPMHKFTRAIFRRGARDGAGGLHRPERSWPSPRGSKIICWKDKSGKVVGCGDKVPPEFEDAATKELDRSGVTRKTTETAEEQAKRAAQDKALATAEGGGEEAAGRAKAPGFGAAQHLREREGDRPEARSRGAGGGGADHPAAGVAHECRAPVTRTPSLDIAAAEKAKKPPSDP